MQFINKKTLGLMAMTSLFAAALVVPTAGLVRAAERARAAAASQARVRAATGHLALAAQAVGRRAPAVG